MSLLGSLAPLAAASQDSYGFSNSDTAVLLLVVVIAALLYIVPSVIAFARHARDKWGILWLNLFLGWTIYGWFQALGMAIRSPRN